MPPSNKTDADGLAVAVALTLKLARIARVFVRFTYVASFVVNANYGVPICLARVVRFFKTLRI
jgi:transcriptional regulator of nitric oxide reductase